MNKKLEITYARAIFCITIVALHSFPGLITDPNTSDFSQSLNSFIRIFLLFATLSFIILSEILLSMRYSEGLPKGFFLKRIKFILLPYLFIGIFYSLNIYFDTSETRSFLDIFATYILYGSWYGWFVIVIFQFYILHAFFHNFLNKMNPIIILLITFIISSSHSFTAYINQDYLQWWADFYPVYSRTAIPYWIFYFTFGYYFGKNYDYVMKMVEKYIWVVVSLWLCSIIPIFMFYHYKDVVYAQSNRFDIILYTILTFLIVLYVMKVLSKYKFSILLLISEISFFIYLSHPLINEYISRGLASFVDIPLLFIVILTVFTLGISIGIAILLSQFPFSKYLIGRNSFKKMLEVNYVNEKDQ
ncbi:acyltransferase family protein [Staphylococcus caeli]|uniref:Probable poly-beta-1,6-N-acetyl-D-glucosamine export protein n=1 Tax=Staphylococcus caeli TaxID=2201815 RepID=A0A1D4IQC4_9STAP|nr:acyltransferase family protein [Staphylococcus caeli]SCS51870.1 intercellular adhesion protein C [Staphylococcus caeli]SCS91231.1 intercellular adhesion protein C [Staphylococcus caeli]